MNKKVLFASLGALLCATPAMAGFDDLLGRFSEEEQQHAVRFFQSLPEGEQTAAVTSVEQFFAATADEYKAEVQDQFSLTLLINASSGEISQIPDAVRETLKKLTALTPPTSPDGLVAFYDALSAIKSSK